MEGDQPQFYFSRFAELGRLALRTCRVPRCSSDRRRASLSPHLRHHFHCQKNSQTCVCTASRLRCFLHPFISPRPMLLRRWGGGHWSQLDHRIASPVSPPGGCADPADQRGRPLHLSLSVLVRAWLRHQQTKIIIRLSCSFLVNMPLQASPSHGSMYAALQ